MWAIKLLMKIIVLPMILVIAVARLGVDLAIKLLHLCYIILVICLLLFLHKNSYRLKIS